MAEGSITITAALTDAQALAFAQFLKRVGLNDFRALAADDEEADDMLHASDAIRRALSDSGYMPRYVDTKV